MHRPGPQPVRGRTGPVRASLRQVTLPPWHDRHVLSYPGALQAAFTGGNRRAIETDREPARMKPSLILESVLFAAGEPVALTELANLLDVPKKELVVELTSL